MEHEENVSVTRFRDYLRIKSVQPDPDYDGCVDFFRKYADEIGLDFQVIEPLPNHPFVIISWRGTNEKLPSIILHSHMDVVPVFPEHWTHDPFAADKDEKGNIYARGSQDMKCVGIQYMEAIRGLKNSGVRLLRTVHVTWSTDEEVGSYRGMAKAVEHPVFKQLNHAFSLDEGLAFPDDVYRVYYGERNKTWLKVTCNGCPGHGSKFIQNTAAEKFTIVVNNMLDFREKEHTKLKMNPNLCLGDVTTVNLTKIEGGVQTNVVPASMTAYFDIRVPPTVDKEEFLKKIDAMIKAAGPGVTYEWPIFTWITNVTSISPNDKWWKAFFNAMKKMDLKFKTEILGNGTDSCYLRNLGYPALGFSPMIHTPQLLHDHDEYLNEGIFLDGVAIYQSLITDIANVPE